MRIRPYLRRAGRLGLLPLTCLALRTAYAGSATWNLNPATNDWNTASNWTPATVPNAITDVATLGTSNTTSVSNPVLTNLAALIFTADAPPYTITCDIGITFWDEGVRNDSEVQQTIYGSFDLFGDASAGDKVTYNAPNATDSLEFHDNASAGTATIYSTIFTFRDNSTAGDATIVSDRLAGAGDQFEGTSSAGNAHITLLGSSEEHVGAVLFLEGEMHPDHGMFIAEPATVAGGYGADIQVLTFGHPLNGGTFIANGSAISNSGFPLTAGIIQMEADAGIGTYIINGATTAQGEGGKMTITGSAGAAFITANGSENGGPGGNVTLGSHSTGGTARIAVYGNGFFNPNVLDPGATIGSLEGDGLVLLGNRSLTIGSNNLSTTFGGEIQDTGAITKIGTGTLTLASGNSYRGGTTVTAGILLVSNSSGSGTGMGTVSVDGGTLGGSGIIAGAVTVGTNAGPGASLAPSKGAKKPATLTIQSTLTLNDDSTYIYQLNTKRAVSDEVIANGVVIDGGAKFSFRPSGNNALTVGQEFTVISNTSASPIAGTFHNLANGKIITVNGSNLQAGYSGGDGNDLTLTVVP
jgi:autotransporter-associated beta strand protein